MKLVDILVEELPKRGGWPEGVVAITQDSDKAINNYKTADGLETNEHGTWRYSSAWEGYSLLASDSPCLASDYDTAIITREQYEAALAAKNDGWIEWGGGECPVEEGVLVDVKYRDGAIKKGLRALIQNSGRSASRLFWVKDNLPTDIIAYRLYKPQEVTEDDDEADLNECIGQDVAPEWNGDGKPTIGTKCEHHSGGQWEVVTIAGIYENLVTGFTDYWMVKEDGRSYTVGNPYRFRPIRSEADKKREEVIMSLAGAVCSAHFTYGEKLSDGQLLGSMWYELYDAIAAGKVRGVKLED